jgi:predicted negative regulator of RcsB-dependent stress response
MIWSREILAGILLVLLIASAVGGLNYYKNYKAKKLEEVAYRVYLFELGKVGEEEILKAVKGTPYEAYVRALKGEEVADLIEDEDIKKLFLEARAYRLYREGKLQEALRTLGEITEEDFNYPSAQLLKALILEKMGELKEARAIYVSLSAEMRGTYIGRVAYARFLSLEGP